MVSMDTVLFLLKKKKKILTGQSNICSWWFLNIFFCLYVLLWPVCFMGGGGVRILISIMDIQCTGT